MSIEGGIKEVCCPLPEKETVAVRVMVSAQARLEKTVSSSIY
jgi:hypothetical protein